MKFIFLKLLLLFALLLPAGAQQGNFVKISTETYEVIYPTNFWLKNRTNIWIEIEGFITSGSGGSNSFGVNNTFYTPWNYTNSAEIEHTVSGSTNFSSSIVANSISTNKIDSTFRNWVTSMGSSGSGVTVNGLTATNFWDNGYITFLDAGGGDWSLNIGNDTISTNKINSTFYNWILSLSGGGGGTTNGLGVNGTFRTDWNAINSAEIAYTISGGTNWYGSLIANSIAASKLATTGTGTSTNFLAGDYSYKQVTTNMIPGLNAILATIGSGGGTNYTQFWYDLTNSVVSSNNISLAYDTTNKKLLISASTGGTNSGTAVTVDGGADNVRINLADSTGIGASLSGTNASFALVDRDFGSVTVSGSGTTITYDNNSISSNHIAAGQVSQDKLGTSGTATATNFLAGDYAWKQVTTNMIPGLNAILATIGTGGSGGGTNIKVNGTLVNNANLVNSSNALFNVSGSDISLTITNVPGSTTDNVLQWLGSAYFIVTNNSTIGDFSVLQTNGIVYNATVIGPGENDAPLVVELNFPSRSTNYIWTFRPEGDVNGFVAYEAEGYRSTNSIRFKLHEAVGSTFFTGGYWMRFDLYDKVSVGGSGGSGSDTNWNGNPIASGTITNLTTSKINSLDYYNIENGDAFSDGDSYGNFISIFYPNWYGFAIAGGSPGTQAGTTNNPSTLPITSSASANSGYAYLTGTTSEDIGGGGKEFLAIAAIAATNSVVARFGFQDSATDTESTDAAYVRLANGYVQGVLRNNSSETTTSTSNRIAPSSTTFYRIKTRVNTDQASVTFFLLSATSPGVFTTNWTASVTNTLPTGSSRLTGNGALAYHTAGSAGTTLIVLDSLGKRNLNILTR